MENLIITAPGYKKYVKENIEIVDDNNGGGTFSLAKGKGEIREVLSLPGVGTGTGIDSDGEEEPDETSDPRSPALENWLDRRKTKVPSSPI